MHIGSVVVGSGCDGGLRLRQRASRILERGEENLRKCLVRFLVHAWQVQEHKALRRAGTVQRMRYIEYIRIKGSIEASRIDFLSEHSDQHMWFARSV